MNISGKDAFALARRISDRFSDGDHKSHSGNRRSESRKCYFQQSQKAFPANPHQKSCCQDGANAKIPLPFPLAAVRFRNTQHDIRTHRTESSVSYFHTSQLSQFMQQFSESSALGSSFKKSVVRMKHHLARMGFNHQRCTVLIALKHSSLVIRQPPQKAVQFAVQTVWRTFAPVPVSAGLRTR